MRRSSKRLLLLIAALPVALLLLALLYMVGMTYLEGQPRTLTRAIEWASETLTTTGYGYDSSWNHPVMQAYVVVVQFLGLFIVFLIFPVFLIPFFEERFEGRLPTKLPSLDNHVVIYRWDPAVTSLARDLEQVGLPVVVLEPDKATAQRLRERQKNVVLSNLMDEDFDLGDLAGARGVVANGTDKENAMLIITIRQNGYKGPIVSLVEDPSRRAALTRVGATAVFTPTHVLAAALAAKASSKIEPRVAGAPMLGDKVAVTEVRIHRESPFAGKPLAEARIRSQTGATVLGLWRAGELVPIETDTQLDAGTILLAVGHPDSMERLGIEYVTDAQSSNSVSRIRRAGADFCLSIGQVAGQLLGFQLLGEESLSIQPQVKIIKARPGSLAGSTVIDSDIRGRTGCSIIAVERGKDVHVNLESFAIEADDTLYVSGSQGSLQSFARLTEGG